MKKLPIFLFLSLFFVGCTAFTAVSQSQPQATPTPPPPAANNRRHLGRCRLHR